MKKLLLIALSFFLMVKLFGQSQGISYQAVIIDQNAQEIAGTDITGNILPNKAIMVRFTILDAVGTVDYQEVYETITDAYGMINLIIGKGTPTTISPKVFTDIDWSGSPKNLKVDISFSNTEVFYTDFSNQELTFVPYAYHKNITATGSLTVDGKSTLQDLTVEATTNLNGSVNVNKNSPTNLSGNLVVEQHTTLKDTLIVNSISNLNGQVTITADINGAEDATNSYPLYVKGSNQGIAIKVDGSRSSSNNFVTFWDEAGIQGRIEGESTNDIVNDPMYYYENTKLLIELAIAGSELIAASTSSSACVGFGACVTVPAPSEIIFAAAQLIIATAEVAMYNVFRWKYAGVVYQSKGADYAEYLLKANPGDKFLPGDIIGVKGGYISRSTLNADKIMIVSGKPIVLGNIPQEGLENSFEKIAFIGQVNANVFGQVNIGDYIIPSGNNDGMGIAVSPDSLKPDDYSKIAGVAWSSSPTEKYGYINVAVGLNSNDIARLYIKQEKKVKEQDKEIQNLKNQLNQMNEVLAQLIPDYAGLMGYDAATSSSSKTNAISLSNNQQISSMTDSVVNSNVQQDELTLYYYPISKGQIDEGITLAKKILKENDKSSGLKSDKTREKCIYPLLDQLESDTSYRKTFIDEMYTSIRNKMEENYQRDIKSGVKVIKTY